jgi:hypothetical protein
MFFDQFMHSLLEDLEKQNRDLLEYFDPNEVARSFSTIPDETAYFKIPGDVEALWNAVEYRFGVSGFDAFQRITMLRLIAQFNDIATARAYGYTPEIIERFGISFARIGQSIADPDYNGYSTVNDIFLKDLGLCRQLLFPAGARLIERKSGIPRSILLRNGLVKGCDFLRLMLRHGGYAPYYQWHTHLSELDEFNSEGWTLFLSRVAGMLEINPHIKGVFGSSWIYDPELTTISPNLSYHIEEPLLNGAFLFFYQMDKGGGSIAKSNKRRQMFYSGHYLPKAYVLIWPRTPLIAWAKRFASSQQTIQPREPLL